MIDELRFNTKLVGFDGVIGRRDYFLNSIYISMISLLFNLPLTGYLMSHAETLTDFFSINKLFFQASWVLKVWIFAGILLLSYMGVSNIIRRLNDINGEVNKQINIAISALFVLTAFGILFPIVISCLLLTVSCIIGLFLLLKKGKITGKYPHDFLKEFNWGAFFATWLWGLFNNSYKPLWMLLLWLTPWGFYFSLVCGLKGNEWAYHNKRWESDEKFKNSQETQTVVFVLLNVVVIPLIYMIIIFSIIGLLAFAVIDEAKTAPDGKSKTIEKLDNALNTFSSLYFESHTITETENKFYVLPRDWAGYSFSEKKDVMDMAANIASSERRKKDKRGYYSKTTELKRTKIYSTKNHELLGEFQINDSVMNSGDWKIIVKETMNAYRFYKPTVK